MLQKGRLYQGYHIIRHISLVLLMRRFKFHSIAKLDVVQQNTQDDLRLNESVYNLTPECNRKNPLCTPHIYYTRAFNVHLFQVCS